jgi:hypothetical protein
MEDISYYKRFCFPEVNSKEKNQGELIYDFSTYIFTRTSSTGQIEYGYCRRIPYENLPAKSFPIAICIGNIQNVNNIIFIYGFLVSTYSYFKLYDAILEELVTGKMNSE